MILQPTLSKVGSLIDNFSDEDWVDEPPLHRASYEFAVAHGGVIVKEFLKALPIDADNYDDLIIDLRFHYLKTGYLSSMDCWHLDFFNPEEKDNEVYLCCLGDCSLTEVLVSTVEVSDINPNDTSTFEKWDSEIESQSYRSVVVSPGNIYQYTPQTFHKGTPATHDGIHIFMRACCLPNMKHANESPKNALYWEPGEKGPANKAVCVR